MLVSNDTWFGMLGDVYMLDCIENGCQVAVAGDNAIGARISLWWPLDEEWYTGFVTAFDPTRQRHTICYDDGDVEIVCLWAPNQLVISFLLLAHIP